MAEHLVPPFIGALLKLSWLRVRQRIRDDLHAAGFDDLEEAYLAVFSYPLPEGVRLGDLARNLRVSRQSANYLVSRLEALDYLDRRAVGPDDRPRIFLTTRGAAAARVIYASLSDLQAEWAQEIGRERFDVFMDVLRTLSRQGQGKG